MKRLAGIAFFSATLCTAQTAQPVVHTFDQPCPAVQPAALQYFQQRGFALTALPSCSHCFEGKSLRLQDESGRRLRSNRKAIETYTNKDLRYEKSGPVRQMLHLNLEATGALRLLPSGSGSCQAELRFQYRWYGAELILGIPVDGDALSGQSNGKLEAAYLAALQTQIDRADVAKR